MDDKRKVGFHKMETVAEDMYFFRKDGTTSGRGNKKYRVHYMMQGLKSFKTDYRALPDFRKKLVEFREW